MSGGNRRRSGVVRWGVGLVAAASLLAACSTTGVEDRPGADVTRATDTVGDPGAAVVSNTSSSTTSTAGATSTSGKGTSESSEPVEVGPDGLPLPVTAPASALVDRLAVAVEDPAGAAYRRKEFGSGWRYDSKSGCNTRELVLIGESRRPAVVDDRCKPESGDWISLYDGVETGDPADLEIDHLVPLADAWRSGASTWSPARRKAFANDLTDPDTLVAVTSHSNRSKGDSSPDQWLPSDQDDRCRYVGAWVRVKFRWSLSATPAEKSTLVQVLSGC